MGKLKINRMWNCMPSVLVERSKSTQICCNQCSRNAIRFLMSIEIESKWTCIFENFPRNSFGFPTTKHCNSSKDAIILNLTLISSFNQCLKQPRLDKCRVRLIQKKRTPRAKFEKTKKRRKYCLLSFHPLPCSRYFVISGYKNKKGNEQETNCQSNWKRSYWKESDEERKLF